MSVVPRKRRKVRALTPVAKGHGILGTLPEIKPFDAGGTVADLWAPKPFGLSPWPGFLGLPSYQEPELIWE